MSERVRQCIKCRIEKPISEFRTPTTPACNECRATAQAQNERERQLELERRGRAANPDGTRHCFRCGKDLPEDAFYLNRLKHPRGLCRFCYSAAERERYYQKRPARECRLCHRMLPRDQFPGQRQVCNDCVAAGRDQKKKTAQQAAQSRRWRENHHEQIRERQREYDLKRRSETYRRIPTETVATLMDTDSVAGGFERKLSQILKGDRGFTLALDKKTEAQQ